MALVPVGREIDRGEKYTINLNKHVVRHKWGGAYSAVIPKGADLPYGIRVCEFLWSHLSSFIAVKQQACVWEVLIMTEQVSVSLPYVSVVGHVGSDGLLTSVICKEIKLTYFSYSWSHFHLDIRVRLFQGEHRRRTGGVRNEDEL